MFSTIDGTTGQVQIIQLGMELRTKTWEVTKHPVAPSHPSLVKGITIY